MPNVPGAGEDAANNAIVIPSTTYYLSLHTANPAQTGTGEGPDGRESIVFNSSSSGTQASTTTQTWPTVVGGNTYGYFGIWTAASGGTFVRGGVLTLSLPTPTAGSEIVISAGGITLLAA